MCITGILACCSAMNGTGSNRAEELAISRLILANGDIAGAFRNDSGGELVGIGSVNGRERRPPCGASPSAVRAVWPHQSGGRGDSLTNAFAIRNGRSARHREIVPHIVREGDLLDASVVYFFPILRNSSSGTESRHALNSREWFRLDVAKPHFSGAQPVLFSDFDRLFERRMLSCIPSADAHTVNGRIDLRGVRQRGKRTERAC
jgi:hypothetical protein